MNFEKKVIKNLNKCYSIAPVVCNGKTKIAVASEKNSPCYLFDMDGTYVETVWEEPGGVMCMVQPGRADGSFLAVERFYSPNEAKEAGIVHCKRTPDGWERNLLVRLPYVHRFDVLERDGQQYLIACTVKSGQNHWDDWSFPGKIWGVPLPGDLSGFSEENQLKLDVVADGLVKNHGYYRLDKCSAVISAEEGVFLVTAPAKAEGAWKITQLIDTPASDAVLIDFDMNGSDELVVISPFHGDKIEVYRYEENDGETAKLQGTPQHMYSEKYQGTGKFCKVYEHHEKLPFLHAIYRISIHGRPAVLLGNREGRRELFALYKKDGNYYMELIDSGCGPANVFACSHNDDNIIFAANREIDEIAMYFTNEL